jgi:hypothetical protein
MREIERKPGVDLQRAGAQRARRERAIDCDTDEFNLVMSGQRDPQPGQFCA